MPDASRPLVLSSRAPRYSTPARVPPARLEPVLELLVRAGLCARPRSRLTPHTHPCGREFAPGFMETLMFPHFGGVGLLESPCRATPRRRSAWQAGTHGSSGKRSSISSIPFVALQQMFNESAEWGTLAYEKSLYLDDLSEDVISVIAEHAPKKSSPLSFCPTFVMTGAYCEVGEDETAFGGSRAEGYVFNIGAHAHTQDLYEADRAWARGFWEALRPHASGSGSYVNFIAEVDVDRVRASYGAEKYERLARIKAAYDPDNVFHLNANIAPEASRGM